MSFIVTFHDVHWKMLEADPSHSIPHDTAFIKLSKISEDSQVPEAQLVVRFSDLAEAVRDAKTSNSHKPVWFWESANQGWKKKEWSKETDTKQWPKATDSKQWPNKVNDWNPPPKQRQEPPAKHWEEQQPAKAYDPPKKGGNGKGRSTRKGGAKSPTKGGKGTNRKADYQGGTWDKKAW